MEKSVSDELKIGSTTRRRVAREERTELLEHLKCTSEQCSFDNCIFGKKDQRREISTKRKKRKTHVDERNNQANFQLPPSRPKLHHPRSRQSQTRHIGHLEGGRRVTTVSVDALEKERRRKDERSAALTPRTRAKLSFASSNRPRCMSHRGLSGMKRIPTPRMTAKTMVRLREIDAKEAISLDPSSSKFSSSTRLTRLKPSTIRDRRWFEFRYRSSTL